jgi:hypothetical protein
MKHKIDVIQIHKSEKVFKKTNYTSADRAEFWNPSEVIASESGYLKEDVLLLPIKYQNVLNFQGCELIILIDGLGFRSDSKIANIEVFRSVKSPKEVGIFTIKKIRPDCYALDLNFKNNDWIGVPKRDNHKICDLLIGQIIRYQLNGKSDFTSSVGWERCFYEFDYHFELLGQATSVEFRNVKELARLKPIRTENCKFINERKILR